MSDGNMSAATGGAFLAFTRGHRPNTECLSCGQDCSRTPLQALVYVFEPCNCGRPHYEHLTERLMHKKHLIRADELQAAHGKG